ncbi:NAD(P)H dehydrogenase (quinone) [Nitrobacteraceae bacterium AZCC 2146]
MYAVTGASGQLGSLTIEALLKKVAPSEIVALARDPAKLSHLADRGLVVRLFDYDRPETLVPALAGVDRLLLISSSEVGKRVQQHGAVIDAAKAAGVSHLVYTSTLHGPANPMGLAAEHVATEEAITASGLAHTILRNGWYTENHAASAPQAVQYGVFMGSAKDGRVSGASRADYAAAAATVLTDGVTKNRVIELAGDDAFTLTEFAAAIGEITGKPVVYKDLPEAEYLQVLEGAGLPAPLAGLLSESDAKIAQGAVYDDSRALSKLIGRPTTPWRETLRAVLQG